MVAFKDTAEQPRFILGMSKIRMSQEDKTFISYKVSVSESLMTIDYLFSLLYVVTFRYNICRSQTG